MADLPGLEAAPDGRKLGKQHSLPHPEPRHLVTVQTASGQAPGKTPLCPRSGPVWWVPGALFPRQLRTSPQPCPVSRGVFSSTGGPAVLGF